MIFWEKFMYHQNQGVCKKKTHTLGCFISIRSHGPSPSPILPKKEINHKTKYRPYAYIWPKSSVWPPLHLSSHNHPRWGHSRLKWHCMILVFVVKSLWLDYDLQAPQWSKFLLPHILHIGKYNWLQWMRHKGGADVNILTVCDNIEACLAWKPGGCPDV